MVKMQISTKRLLIDKTNSRNVIMTAIAAFVVVFTLVAAKSLISQAAYQNRVINADKTALSQLKSDIQATNALVTSYQAFVGTPQNVLGGNPSGKGAKDGDNAKIVLDALPSEYDFPALATSLEKLLTTNKIQIQSITGTDQEVSQQSAAANSNPQPVAMPFQITVSGNYTAVQALINEFGQSIRPIQVQSIQLSGDQNNMSMTLSAQTYYQPQKQLSITQKDIQ
jgi:Pilus assembly protein, PilO